MPLWKKNEYIAKENLSLVAYVQSSCDTPSGRDEYGSFQLEFVSVSLVINPMTCYKFECSHWWKMYV